MQCRAVGVMFWQQLSFIGHGCGHNSVRGSDAADTLSRTAHRFLIGITVLFLVSASLNNTEYVELGGHHIS